MGKAIAAFPYEKLLVRQLLFFYIYGLITVVMKENSLTTR